MKEFIYSEPKLVYSQEVGLRCSKCKQGSVIWDNDCVALLSIPPRYNHTCNNCGNKSYQESKYPYREFTCSPINKGDF